MHTRTDQNGDVTTYTYDKLHRLTQRSYTINSSVSYPATQPPDTYTYDRAGRMLTAVHDSGTNAYVDAFTNDTGGAVTKFVQGPYAEGFAYVIDANSNRRTITYPGGLVIREDADKRGRVTTVKDVTTNGRPTLAANTYDTGDRLTQRDFGDGTRGTWSYDDANRVIRVTDVDTSAHGTAIMDLSYERDAVGNPSCRQDLVTTNLSETYAYDAADRLTDFQRGDINTSTCAMATTNTSGVIGEQTWTLDPLGNWNTNGITASGVLSSQHRVHNTSNEITSLAGTTLDYDTNGNLRYDGTYVYQYDAENRLTRVAPFGIGGVLVQCYYDALGRRVRKVLTNTDYDADYRYVWSPDWQLLEVYTVVGISGTLKQSFVHAGSPGRPYNGPQPPSAVGMGGIGPGGAYVDDHVAMYKASGNVIYYYHADAQFNTQAITTAGKSPVVAATYVLSAYGIPESTTVSGPGGLGTLATNNAMIHQGLLYEPETGVYYNRWREYLPALGRFAQRDPVPNQEDPNLYDYLGSQPETASDPAGDWPIWYRPPPSTPQPPPASQPPQSSICDWINEQLRSGRGDFGGSLQAGACYAWCTAKCAVLGNCTAWDIDGENNPNSCLATCVKNVFGWPGIEIGGTSGPGGITVTPGQPWVVSVCTYVHELRHSINRWTHTYQANNWEHGANELTARAAEWRCYTILLPALGWVKDFFGCI